MKKFIKKLSPFQKRYYPIFITLSALFITFLVLILTLPAVMHPWLLAPDNKTKRSGWPARLAAPYIDMSSWVETTSAYSLNGAPNLGKLCDETGFKYFNLGFIQPDTENPLKNDGNINWGWGGYGVLTKANAASNAQYQGIVQSLTNLRSKGGDFAISIGGQVGAAPWVVTQNQNALENFYADIIGTYELKRLDLDIEESNQDAAQNAVNARAIKSVQDRTNIEITLTIPIMPYGWDEKQISVINAYLDAGVDVLLINSMTMCYGTGLYEGENYGEASVRAMNNAFAKIKEIYSNHGFDLTDDQAYLKLGATYSIGYENSLYPVFTTEMSSLVVDDAIAHNYGLVSFWSMGRDAKLESNSYITNQYMFSEILKQYNSDKK